MKDPFRPSLIVSSSSVQFSPISLNFLNRKEPFPFISMDSYMNFINFEETPQTQATGSKPAATPPLVRQSSVYSLTFDEFQNTLLGSGKDFGSMNMDELLKNIWTAEETQAIATSTVQGSSNHIPSGNLNRQGSLTLPRTISQKTVDEVWKELYNNLTLGPNLQQQQKQPTLKEITLEEFLFRAGVVREDVTQTAVPNNNGLYNDNTGLSIGFQQSVQNNIGINGQILDNNIVPKHPSSLPINMSNQPSSLPIINNNNTGLSIGFQQSAQNNIGINGQILDNNIVPKHPSSLPINMSNQPSSLPIINNYNNGLSIGFQQLGQNNIGVVNGRILDNNNIVPNQPSCLAMNISGTRPPQQQLAQTCFPKQANMTFASSTPMAKNSHIASPSINSDLFQENLVSGAKMGGVVNQLSPDGDTSSVSPSPYMLNGGARGRKSGTLEKAMERRHRRMIKNRESAARSRSRKQAYTLELEAEVEKLKEMNNELRKKQDELMEMQKNQVSETTKTPLGSKRRCLRRTLTWPW